MRSLFTILVHPYVCMICIVIIVLGIQANDFATLTRTQH